MLVISALYVLSYSLLFAVLFYLALTRFSRGVKNRFSFSLSFGEKPYVRYRQDSRLCKQLASACSTLESYIPPLLWGRNGHLQTIVFGVAGRFSLLVVPRRRHSIVLEDGSTLSYDVFGGEGSGENSPYTFIVCPGIGNTSETSYIKAFASTCVREGFQVAVLNHLGGLEHVALTGNRIYTYGGTGDLAAVFESLRSCFPDHQFIGVGFSLGACILVRFLGEKPERQKHFVCAASICQGYDPSKAATKFNDWVNLCRMYNAIITRKQLKIFHRHKHRLLDRPHYGNVNCEVTHGGYDCNGFSLDPSKIQLPVDANLSTLTNILDFDECYSRRVQGFDSVMDLYEWTSCVRLMYKIEELPMLFVNSLDDPVIPVELHDIPVKYTDHNPNAMFVRTTYGGHMGFFEGGVLIPHPTSWVDRLILEYSQSCINLKDQ